MTDRTFATFHIDITSVREHTWQGRVTCGDQIRCFESELQMLRYMIELMPGLAPEICWPAGCSQEQEDVL